MPFELLSTDDFLVEEMAAHLGLSCEQVVQREHAGDLFSYCKQSRGQQRLYPTYQVALANSFPDLLQRAKAALEPNTVQVHCFFTQRDPDLAGLSVREVLSGRPRESLKLNSLASWLLSLPLTRRVDAVLSALERERAHSEAW
ncbi:hypothetical protein [Piscinibacter sp. HJYY11]|uniref:hypothetical protein n=1 Tax=Piscinibacter sp. HJYY11 TaxID=2801333 RepID=UPI00191E7CC6|nr:hypothetical protein [Piscinibacter sp. HJYY11]MBL0729581.1 hypothetical protein [Piscinibacter sp. HJYY11]